MGIRCRAYAVKRAGEQAPQHRKRPVLPGEVHTHHRVQSAEKTFRRVVVPCVTLCRFAATGGAVPVRVKAAKGGQKARVIARTIAEGRGVGKLREAKRWCASRPGTRYSVSPLQPRSFR